MLVPVVYFVAWSIGGAITGAGAAWALTGTIVGFVVGGALIANGLAILYRTIRG